MGLMKQYTFDYKIKKLKEAEMKYLSPSYGMKEINESKLDSHEKLEKQEENYDAKYNKFCLKAPTYSIEKLQQIYYQSQDALAYAKERKKMATSTQEKLLFKVQISYHNGVIKECMKQIKNKQKNKSAE